MEWALVGVLVAMAIGAGMWWQFGSKKRRRQELADARAEAERWYERLGGQLMNLHGDEPAVKQALADASERYTATGSQLERAATTTQFELARETALEGLAYIRAARIALGIDPGPALPPLAAARATGQITKPREVEVEGHAYRASPDPRNDTPYYYPGGRVQGRPVPAGWYSEPWWKTALVAGAGAVGTLLIFDALFSPAWGDPGYGFDSGYQEGFQDGADYGADQGDQGDFGDGGDQGDFGGGDYADAGDFGGGDFGGGDFGGGDF
jgi:uncharacterized membrane protein YgcG